MSTATQTTYSMTVSTEEMHDLVEAFGQALAASVPLERGNPPKIVVKNNDIGNVNDREEIDNTRSIEDRIVRGVIQHVSPKDVETYAYPEDRTSAYKPHASYRTWQDLKKVKSPVILSFNHLDNAFKESGTFEAEVMYTEEHKRYRDLEIHADPQDPNSIENSIAAITFGKTAEAKNALQDLRKTEDQKLDIGKDISKLEAAKETIAQYPDIQCEGIENKIETLEQQLSAITSIEVPDEIDMTFTISPKLAAHAAMADFIQNLPSPSPAT